MELINIGLQESLYWNLFMVLPLKPEDMESLRESLRTARDQWLKERYKDYGGIDDLLWQIDDPQAAAYNNCGGNKFLQSRQHLEKIVPICFALRYDSLTEKNPIETYPHCYRAVARSSEEGFNGWPMMELQLMGYGPLLKGQYGMEDNFISFEPPDGSLPKNAQYRLRIASKAASEDIKYRYEIEEIENIKQQNQMLRSYIQRQQALSERIKREIHNLQECPVNRRNQKEKGSK